MFILTDEFCQVEAEAPTEELLLVGTVKEVSVVDTAAEEVTVRRRAINADVSIWRIVQI